MSGVRRDLFIVLLACLAVFFIGLGASGLIDPGDGYYSEGAREMIESGDYVVPHLNNQVYFSKPILIFWIIALAYKMFGINEFAARFWSAVSAAVAAFIIYVLTRQLANRRAALTASAIFIASPLVITFARMAMIDMILSALLSTAVWAFINTACFERKNWWVLVYLALALGFLVKGPIAPLLFLLSIAVYLLTKRSSINELKKVVRLLHPFAGSAVFLLIVIPWCIAVSIATKGLFLKVFLWFENVRRFLGHVNHRHPEPWFYIPVIIYGFFPWLICLPAAINDALKRKLISSATSRDTTMAKNTTLAKDVSTNDEFAPQQNAVLYLACWSLCVLIFFSLARAKVETYILPCWFSFAVLAGIWLTKEVETSKLQSPELQSIPWTFSFLSGTCFACAIAIASISLMGFITWHHIYSLSTIKVLSVAISAANHVLSVMAPPQFLCAGLGILILCIGWVYQWFLLQRRKLRQCLVSVVLPAVLTAALVTPVAAQIMYVLKEADLNAVAIQGRGLKLAIFLEFKPSLMFYTHQPIDSFFAPGQLVPVQSISTKSKTQYVIVSDKSLPLLQTAHGNCFKLIYKKGVWGLYQAQGLTLLHLPSLEQTFRQELNLSVGDYHWGTLPFASGAD